MAALSSFVALAGGCATNPSGSVRSQPAPAELPTSLTASRDALNAALLAGSADAVRPLLGDGALLVTWHGDTITQADEVARYLTSRIEGVQLRTLHFSNHPFPELCTDGAYERGQATVLVDSAGGVVVERLSRYALRWRRDRRRHARASCAWRWPRIRRPRPASRADCHPVEQPAYRTARLVVTVVPGLFSYNSSGTTSSLRDQLTGLGWDDPVKRGCSGLCDVPGPTPSTTGRQRGVPLALVGIRLRDRLHLSLSGGTSVSGDATARNDDLLALTRLHFSGYTAGAALTWSLPLVELGAGPAVQRTSWSADERHLLDPFGFTFVDSSAVSRVTQLGMVAELRGSIPVHQILRADGYLQARLFPATRTDRMLQLQPMSVQTSNLLLGVGLTFVH